MGRRGKLSANSICFFKLFGKSCYLCRVTWVSRSSGSWSSSALPLFLPGVAGALSLQVAWLVLKPCSLPGHFQNKIQKPFKVTLML